MKYPVHVIMYYKCNYDQEHVHVCTYEAKQLAICGT